MTDFNFAPLLSLMEQWKSTHKNRGWKNFISDGAVDPTIYGKSSPRLCFFLKEAYTKGIDTDWSLTEWLASGAMTRMWGIVAEWTYGIRNTTPEYIPHKPQLNRSEKAELLNIPQHIAIGFIPGKILLIVDEIKCASFMLQPQDAHITIQIVIAHIEMAHIFQLGLVWLIHAGILGQDNPHVKLVFIEIFRQ